jgi:hypothetical protein
LHRFDRSCCSRKTGDVPLTSMLSVLLVPAGLWFLVWLAKHAFERSQGQQSPPRTIPDQSQTAFDLGFGWLSVRTRALNKLPDAILRCLTRERHRSTLPVHTSEPSSKPARSFPALFYDVGAFFGLCGLAISLVLLLLSLYSLVGTIFHSERTTLVPESPSVASLHKRLLPSSLHSPSTTSALTLKPLVRSFAAVLLSAR